MPSTAYVLIATSNVKRAATFRQAVSEAAASDVVVVRDGEEALQQMAQRGWPALLLVDLSLPKVDGFAVLRRVRRQASAMDTRIIVVAAHEPLRVAARELASTLAISQILPIDVDRSVLREMVSAELGSPRWPAAESPAAAFTAPLRDSPATDCDDVMDRAVIELRRKFKMPVSVGYLRNAEQENLTLHVAARGSDATVAINDPAEFKFLRQVAETTEPLVVPNVENHPVFGQFLTKAPRPLRGFAAVPVMTSRDSTTGALCVFDTKPLTLNATDIDSLASFGRQVGQELDRLPSAGADQKAPAVDVNVEDVKALQHLAATDPLTGLANRRGGEKHISNEISRAKREKRPLSCILLDIDRFKQVNDTFGHQAGDQLLRDISLLLRRTLRAYDILVRWGGEEFLIVLPGVDLDAARALAERVRVAVEGMDTHGIGPVTISAGAAKFEHDYDFAATLKTADRRLYQSKASGRNRVV